MRVLAGALAWLAVASGVLAAEQIRLGPNESEPPLAPWMITYDQAAALVLGPDATALELARGRPVRDREITAIRFRLRDSRDDTTTPKLMRLRRTPQGLQYYTHVGLDGGVDGGESGLWLFGVGSVATRGAWDKDKPLQVEQVRLRRGRLFTLDQPFTYETWRAGRRDMVCKCRPARTLDAAQLHPGLQGRAAVFSCLTDSAALQEQMRTLVVYLDAYAQYLPHSNPQDEGDGWTRFEIADVVTRAAR